LVDILIAETPDIMVSQSDTYRSDHGTGSCGSRWTATLRRSAFFYGGFIVPFGSFGLGLEQINRFLFRCICFLIDQTLRDALQIACDK